jgi:hypothetical protein
MRFPCIYKLAANEDALSAPEMMETMGKLIERAFKEGCLPSALSARVRNSGGNYTVTDSAFTESKQIVGGFASIQTRSKEDALEFTRRFLKVAGDGETGIRQFYEQPASNAYPTSISNPKRTKNAIHGYRQSHPRIRTRRRTPRSPAHSRHEQIHR